MERYKRRKYNAADLKRLRWVWVAQVAANRRLTPATFKVAYFFSDHFTMSGTAAEYVQTGDIVVWCSQERLREITDLGSSTVSRSLADLCRRGHLKQIQRGRWNAGANHYQVVFKKEAAA